MDGPAFRFGPVQSRFSFQPYTDCIAIWNSVNQFRYSSACMPYPEGWGMDAPGRSAHSLFLVQRIGLFVFSLGCLFRVQDKVSFLVDMQRHLGERSIGWSIDDLSLTVETGTVAGAGVTKIRRLNLTTQMGALCAYGLKSIFGEEDISSCLRGEGARIEGVIRGRPKVEHGLTIRGRGVTQKLEDPPCADQPRDSHHPPPYEGQKVPSLERSVIRSAYRFCVHPFPSKVGPPCPYSRLCWRWHAIFTAPHRGRCDSNVILAHLDPVDSHCPAPSGLQTVLRSLSRS